MLFLSLSLSFSPFLPPPLTPLMMKFVFAFAIPTTPTDHLLLLLLCCCLAYCPLITCDSTPSSQMRRIGAIPDVIIPAKDKHTGCSLCILLILYKIDSFLMFQQNYCTATVIFMHGLGDSAKGWESEIRFFSTFYPHIKWILPTAYVPPPKQKT